MPNGFIHFFYIIGAGRLPRCERDEFFHADELITDGFDERVVAHSRRNAIDLALHKTDQSGLSKHFRAALVIVLHDGRTDDLGAANPASQANEDNEILVAV